MMTYRQFYEAACALLPDSRGVNVQVETWNHRDTDNVTTGWSIYCVDRREHYRGASPEAALSRCRERCDTHAPGEMPATDDTCVVVEDK